MKKCICILLTLAISALCLTACGQQVVTSEIWIDGSSDNITDGKDNNADKNDKDDKDDNNDKDDKNDKNNSSSKKDNTSNTTSKDNNNDNDYNYGDESGDDSSSKKSSSSSKKSSVNVGGPGSYVPKDEVGTKVEIGKNSDKFLVTGKAVMSNAGCKMMGTADSISFTVSGSGTIAINYSGTGINTNNGYGIYFTLYYNGKRQDKRLHISSNKGQLVLVTDAEPGTHTFKLVRQTEYNPSSSITFTSVATEGNLSSTPYKKNYTIEFIGDSITAGYGSIYDQVTGFDGIWSGAPCFQDGTQTYAYMTAEKLGAEITVTAKSGIGIVKNSEGTKTMPVMYPSYPTSNFTYPDKPDLIVISLGTNDTWQKVSNADFITGMKSFAATVRAKHGNDVPIIFLGGQMVRSSFNTTYAAVASQLGGAAKNYYSYVVTSPVAASGHPVASEHEKYADELVKFINSKNLLK